jgi:hypothetical protein
MKIHSLLSLIIGIVFTVASLDGHTATSTIKGLSPVKATGSTTTGILSESNAVTVLTSGVERNPVSVEPNHWVGNFTVPVGKNLLCPKDQIPYAILTPFSMQQDSGTGFTPLCVVKAGGNMQYPVNSGTYSKWTVDTGVYINMTPGSGGTYAIAYYVAPLSDKDGKPLTYTAADGTGLAGKVVGATPFNWTIYCYPKSSPPPTAITTAECKKPRTNVYVPPISQTFNFYRGTTARVTVPGAYDPVDKPVAIEIQSGNLPLIGGKAIIPLSPMASKSNPTATTIRIPADGIYTFQLKADVYAFYDNNWSSAPRIYFGIGIASGPGGPGGSGTGYNFLEGGSTTNDPWQTIPNAQVGYGSILHFEGTITPTQDPYNINSAPLILKKGETTVTLFYSVQPSISYQGWPDGTIIILSGQLTMTRTGP